MTNQMMKMKEEENLQTHMCNTVIYNEEKQRFERQ